MSDIVERLRACRGVQSGDPECCCAEAADEIERLRAEFVQAAIRPRPIEDELRAAIKRLMVLVAKLQAEIELCK